MNTAKGKIDILDVNARAAIAFGLAVIAFLLALIIFFK